MTDLWLNIIPNNDNYQTCINLSNLIDIVNKIYDGTSTAQIELTSNNNNYVTITDTNSIKNPSSKQQGILFPRIYTYGDALIDTCGYVYEYFRQNNNFTFNITSYYQSGHVVVSETYFINLTIDYIDETNTKKSNTGTNYGYKIEFISITNTNTNYSMVGYYNSNDPQYINNSNISDSYNATGTLIIEPANLTITADSPTMTYNGNAYTQTTFSSVGLASSDTIGSVTTTINASDGTVVSNPINVGTYTLTPSNATGGIFSVNNYNITYTPGTLTIKLATITPSFNSVSKYYDGNTNANAQIKYTLTGIISGQTLTLSYNANYLTPTVGTNKEIDIKNITINSNGYSSNYILSSSSITIFDGQILENNINNIKQYINQYTLKIIKKIKKIQIGTNSFAVLYIDKFVFVVKL